MDIRIHIGEIPLDLQQHVRLTDTLPDRMNLAQKGTFLTMLKARKSVWEKRNEARKEAAEKKAYYAGQEAGIF